MNELQIFNNPEFGQVRTITIDDIPYFVGKDVAEILGYSNSRKAIGDHVDDEDKLDGVTICDSIGRGQKPVLINESGLYSLILTSKLPTAKKFKHWVTSEVLPTIRRTGHYEVNGYTPKATSIGEVVNLIKTTRETMKEQGCSPTDIAVAVKEICEQFNVRLPNCFIKPKETTMNDVMDMIDFVYSQPKGRGRKKSTYDDFVIYQTTLRLKG